MSYVNKKPKKVKIVNWMLDTESENRAEIYGFGDDQNMYFWSRVNECWILVD